jgi:DNA-dependent protein kinase catalytic subunit
MKRTYFAKKENILKSRRREVSKELKRKREGQVKILRKYRVGDIPDIQIPLSAVLKPLQTLAKV